MVGPLFWKRMSSVPVNNIARNSGVVERFLDAKKWKEAVLTFCRSMPHLIEFYRSNEDNASRRLKKKYSDELSRKIKSGEIRIKVISPLLMDQGPVEAKMRQIIQEQDEKRTIKKRSKLERKDLKMKGFLLWTCATRALSNRRRRDRQCSHPSYRDQSLSQF